MPPSKKKIMQQRNKSKKPHTHLPPAAEFNIPSAPAELEQPDFKLLDPSSYKTDQYGMKSMPQVDDWVISSEARAQGVSKGDFVRTLNSRIRTVHKPINEHNEELERKVAQEKAENGESSTQIAIADSLNNPFHDPKHSEKLEDIYQKQVDLEDFIKRQQDDRKEKKK